MMADADSRIVDYNEEYIPRRFYEKICKITKMSPTIDMMATSENRRTRRFVNRGPTNNEDAIAFDVFAVDRAWVKDDTLFFFPPKNILSQVLFLIANRFMENKVLLIIHLFEEYPKGFARIIADQRTRVRYWRGAPLSIIPDDKVLLFDGKVRSQFSKLTSRKMGSSREYNNYFRNMRVSGTADRRRIALLP